MAEAARQHLTLAESGALALEVAAVRLDRAGDADQFVSALENNRRVWQAIRDIARRNDWAVPTSSLADYVLSTGRGANDDRVHALIHINRRVSAELAQGGDIQRIRERAYYIWEERGRPHGQDIEHWLLAEMEI